MKVLVLYRSPHIDGYNERMEYGDVWSYNLLLVLP